MRVLNITIKNYRSFNHSEKFDFNYDDENITLIYGPNGAGKSNFFKAFRFMCNLIKNSTHFIADPETPYEPFLLHSSIDPTSSFAITIEVDNKKSYMYSFSISKGAITDERLELITKEGRNTIFSRKSIRNNEYVSNNFTKELLHSTRKDSLVLTRAYEVNNKIARDFFAALNRITFYSFPTAGDSKSITSKKIQNNLEYKNKVLSLLQGSDLFIQDISAKEIHMPDDVFNILPLKDDFKQNLNRIGYQVVTSHFIRDDNGKVIGIRKMDLGYHESNGARRIYELAAPVIDALDNGDTIYIDDFDSTLHPKECEFIVSLFRKENNPNNAHLIANTHCTPIMDVVNSKNIYLFGKNNFEETEIESIPGTARNVAIQKKYNKGIFSAIPRVGV